MIKKLELYLKQVISGRRRGLDAFCIKAFLLPLSELYRFFVSCRNWLYDKGWMRRYVPPVPLVISVGNIVAGGTGKTPVTLMLAEAFYGRFKLAILSRGYRSKVEKLAVPVFLCEGEGPLFPASYCGDEPYLFAKRLPKALVIVGRNRRKASILAAKAGADVILLDDGMQHRRLVKDFEIVVVDAGSPFGNGYFLPRGFLREEREALKRGDLIFVNHLDDLEQWNHIQALLKNYTAAPFVGAQAKISSLQGFSGKRLELTQGMRVGMFCAIAHPEYFRRTLEQQGLKVVSECILADHDSFSEDVLKNAAEESLEKGAECLVCTEKDHVKLQEFLSFPLPIFWAQMKLHIVAGQENWERFMQKAEAKLNNFLV